ncbi:hypothetical protein VTN77DRAFT_6389 [Rasamsonia byssochlamydoides]|uniref:uncharacterized protein n=1 Tax=Rasamsonia byssochlamydoides TaxID=89139 RepID=UPI0037439DA9
MSRRPTPDRAAQNQQVIKNLLKLEHNKICADCKRNKHPRWASWNLGVFICIRCSGIHRGMGTHISRVKSVDLDSWTDEQLQSVMKWGNLRANKYWEAKLGPGHVPSEAKIENFIRTKYESKRWVMDGPMPDPSTLDGDDDVPLAVVQEKAKLERSASQRVSSTSSQPPARQQARPQSIDLFGDDDIVTPPARPNTTDPPAAATRPPPTKTSTQPAAKHKPADSLLGLDFFGSSQSTPSSRSGSTAPASGGSTGMSRPDLKQSILSLYATAPKPQPAPAQHERASSFGNLSSSQSQSSSNLGALTDAFSGLSFPATKPSSPPPQKAQDTSPFSNLASFASAKSPPAAPKVTSGGLFDSIASNAAAKPAAARTSSTSSNGLDFSFTKTSSAATSRPTPAPSATNDLFDLASPPTTTASPPPPKPASPPSTTNENSVFNLSLSSLSSKPAPKTTATTSTSTVTSMFSSASIDPWGSNAWSTPDPTPASSAAPAVSSLASTMKVPDTLTANDIGAGWGAPTKAAAATTSTTPTVAADEDFGGWTSAAPTSSNDNTISKPVTGFGGATDDLFSNVWQ